MKLATLPKVHQCPEGRVCGQCTHVPSTKPWCVLVTLLLAQSESEAACRVHNRLCHSTAEPPEGIQSSAHAFGFS